MADRGVLQAWQVQGCVPDEAPVSNRVGHHTPSALDGPGLFNLIIAVLHVENVVGPQRAATSAANLAGLGARPDPPETLSCEQTQAVRGTAARPEEDARTLR